MSPVYLAFIEQCYIIEYENHFHIQRIIMRRGEKYNTKQRERILAIIKSEKASFSAKDIYGKLNKEIGLTTIYRSLDNLVHDSLILKVESKDHTTKYQYTKPCNDTDHFYLKCEKCGKLEHVDCKKVSGLTEHILSKHHFRISSKHVIIHGLCGECIA